MQLSTPPQENPPPIPAVITLVDKRMSPPFALDPTSIPAADVQIFTDSSVRDIIVNGGTGLVVLSQDDLVHEWHPPSGTHSNSFQAENAALKEAIQWLFQFHHGPQISSSTTAIHWSRPSVTLTQLIRLSSISDSARHVEINPDRVGSWSQWHVR